MEVLARGECEESFAAARLHGHHTVCQRPHDGCESIPFIAVE